MLFGIRLYTPEGNTIEIKPRWWRFEEHIADPFLVEVDHKVWCLYERKCFSRKGEIFIVEIKDNKINKSQKVNLKTSTHLSFPFVFSFKEKLYLIPENAENGGVDLYEIEALPSKVIRIGRLLTGNFRDSHLIQKGEDVFLITTERLDGNEKKRLFVVGDFEQLKIFPHPKDPILEGFGYRSRQLRSGGAVFVEGGRMFYPTQVHANSYGEDLDLLEIKEISKTGYKEIVVEENYLSSFGTKSKGHHFFKLRATTGTYVVTDFQMQLNCFFQLAKKFRRAEKKALTILGQKVLVGQGNSLL